MPRKIDRDEVELMVQEGAQLVEVLPHLEYEEFHLPGAMNIPLKEFTRESLAQLRKDVPVITYCSDSL